MPSQSIYCLQMQVHVSMSYNSEWYKNQMSAISDDDLLLEWVKVIFNINASFSIAFACIIL